MKVLVVGSGGREHALVWKISRSPLVSQVFCAPGNPGIGAMARNIPIAATDAPALATWAVEQAIDLVVIGPEDPLAAGIVDLMRERGLRVFGPTRAAAEIESSKAWAKEFFARHGVPSARFARFDHADAARAHVARSDFPLVVKASGLAQGKGVAICRDRAEAEAAIQRLMEERVFGNAGGEVVIEEFLVGHEFSVIGISDGETILLLEPATDHKAVFDGDRGPNTGGMGAYAPPAFVTPEVMQIVERDVFRPTIAGLAHEGRPFVGFLYAGPLILTRDGPKLVEFNARFGDPEAQVILPRLDGDLVEFLLAATAGELGGHSVRFTPQACCAVVVASGGYPEKYQTGFPITGLDGLDPNVLVFHAGTRNDDEGRLVTAGGRVLAVTALGADLAAARARAYENVARVHFEGMHFRHDIAARAVV